MSREKGDVEDNEFRNMKAKEHPAPIINLFHTIGDNSFLVWRRRKTSDRPTGHILVRETHKKYRPQHSAAANSHAHLLSLWNQQAHLINSYS